MPHIVSYIRTFVVNILAMFVAILFFLGVAEVAVRGLGLELTGVKNWGTKASVMRVSKDREIGLELIPGASGRIIGIDVSISEDGLRDRIFPKQKPEGVRRVIALGDSITFGYGVERHQTYAKQLEKLLNDRQPGKWEVINLGVPGVNSTQYVANMIKRGLAYDPDYVVLGYCLNDVDPPALNMPNRLAEGTTDLGAYQKKKRSKMYKEGKKLMAWEIPVPPSIEKTLIGNSSLYRLVSKRWDILLNRYGVRNNNPFISVNDTRQSWEKYFDSVLQRYNSQLFDVVKSDFIRLKKSLDEQNVPLVTAIFPFELEVDGHYPYQPIHDKLNALLGSIAVDVIDVKQVYKDAGLGNEQLWVGGFDMIHPKPPGHLAVAKALGEWLLHKEKAK